ncbi:MAG TPA: hypothetical protein VLA16_05735 [Ideonella sp.]|nr:hypothetical protein [Ideonella sp.]
MPLPPALHRQVFFLGGFDPKSPRYYHRLYRGAVAGRPAAQGERVSLTARRDAGPLLAEWDVRWESAGGETLATRYAVLRWDDIVLRHWARTGLQVLKDYWNVYVDGTRQRLFQRTWPSARATWVVGVFPLLVGSSLALLFGLLGAGGWALAGGPLSAWPLLAGAGALAALWLLTWRAVERRIDTEWLLRLLGFSHAQACDQLPELEERLDAMAAELVKAASGSTAQEILVVGHSTGSILAASVVARALRQAPWLGSQGPGLAMLTLGHCTPLLAYFERAQRFREELALLADAPALTWFDYSAPADWAAFARVPPWFRAGRARLHQASPRFHKTMAAADYQRLLKNRRALHLHYLNAPAIAGGYDVVTLTAGPLTLAQRHAALTSAATAAVE